MDSMQKLGVVARLFPLILTGEKTSTIRWREARIVPGPMLYIHDDDPAQRAVVIVTRCTDMPLSAVADYLGRSSEWPPEVMLAGMREHYPEIEMDDVVQVIEHEPFAGNQSMTKRRILRDIQSLIRLFRPHCADEETLERLDQMIEVRRSWPKARSLFEAIRVKTLKAEQRRDAKAEAQYCFEEVCAKTLYNLTMQPAPYDPDTPYWIIPNALSLARELGLSSTDVVAIIDPPRPS